MLAENYDFPHRQEKKQWILQVGTLTMDWYVYLCAVLRKDYKRNSLGSEGKNRKVVLISAAHKPTLQSCRDGWHKISVRKTQTPEVTRVSESAEKMSLSEGDGGHNPPPSPWLFNC